MIRTIALTVAAALLGACAFNVPIRPSLEGSRWQVVAINGAGVPRAE